MSLWCWLLRWMPRMWKFNLPMLSKWRAHKLWTIKKFMRHDLWLTFIIRMLPRMKTGTIVWTSMDKDLHAAYTIAMVMQSVRRIVSSNLKRKLTTARVRWVCDQNATHKSWMVTIAPLLKSILVTLITIYFRQIVKQAVLVNSTSAMK